MFSLDLETAIKRARADPHVAALKDYFLASVFSIIDDKQDIRDWTLLYYSKKEHRTADCIVNEAMVSVTDVIPAQKGMEKLDLDIRVSVKDAMGTARKKYSKKIINIMISLHQKERPLWTITMVGADITATSFDIDARTGKILREETVSLMRKEK